MTTSPLAKSKRAKIILSLLAAYALVTLAVLVDLPGKSAPVPDEHESPVLPDATLAPTAVAAAPQPAQRARRTPTPALRTRGQDGQRAEPTTPALAADAVETAISDDTTDQPAGPRPNPRLDQQLADAEQQWESESDDPRWTDHERANTVDLFAQLKLPAELLHDVRCRSSVCRITVAAEDPMRLAGLAGYLSENDPSVSFRVEDGEAFAYVSRDHAASPAR